jgi:hypothetical protein
MVYGNLCSTLISVSLQSQGNVNTVTWYGTSTNAFVSTQFTIHLYMLFMDNLVYPNEQDFIDPG